jgi:hypothetical protein
MAMDVLGAGEALFVGALGLANRASADCRAALNIRLSADGGAVQTLGSFPYTASAPWVTVTSGRVIHSRRFL